MVLVMYALAPTPGGGRLINPWGGPIAGGRHAWKQGRHKELDEGRHDWHKVKASINWMGALFKLWGFLATGTTL